MNPCCVILFCVISLGYLLHLIGLFSPYWKVLDQEDTTIDIITRVSIMPRFSEVFCVVII